MSKRRTKQVEVATFDEWKAKGRCVCPGERHTGRNTAGRPTFTKGQTMTEAEFEDFVSDLEGCRHEIY